MEGLVKDRSGGKSFSDIEDLNLAKANLTSLDADVLSRCTNLISLDISRNQLKDLSGLLCSNLKSLNFENNSVTDLTVLSQLPFLETLYIDGNPLSIADRYIAVDQLPRLQTLDGKPCSDIQKATKKFGENLEKQGTGLYQLKYEELMKNCSDVQDKDRCQKQFLRDLLNKMSSCSEVPPSYRRFKVQKFIDNVVETVDVSVTEALEKLKLSSTRPRKFRSSPRKKVPSPLQTTTQSAPRTPSKNKHANSDHVNFSPTKRSRVNNFERFLDFEPQLALRLHSNNSQDADTPIWCAAFEPDISDQRKTTNIVATCGGNIVCFTNCKTEHVLMKYKDDSPSENLYALAWTVLPTGENKPEVTMLAAGGVNKKIHLILPSRRICYSSFKAHTQAIDTLHFHPINKTWLFSGGKDKNIHLWDVGAPQWTNLKTSQKKLMTFDAGAEVLRTLFLPGYKCLFAATDRGLMVWDLTGEMSTWKRGPQTKLIIPENCKSKDSDLVDGMVLLSERTMAIKVSQSGKICLWDFSAMFSEKKLKKESTFEMIPFVTFLWSNCTSDYIYIDCCKETGILACGDDTGRIWCYDVERYTKRNWSFAVETSVQAPSVVFPWPKLTFEEEEMAVRQKVIINSVKFDSSGKYLVICTDSNLIPIWKKV